jgi:hypothetical protein
MIKPRTIALTCKRLLCYFDLGSVSLRNTMEKSANPEDTEPAAKVLARLLDDMGFFGLIEFKTDAASGSCWVVAEQILQAEPIKQDRSKRPPAITA